MTDARNAAPPAVGSKGRYAATIRDNSHDNRFEAEARELLAAEAAANNWPSGSWEKFIPALADQLAHPRRRRKAVVR